MRDLTTAAIVSAAMASLSTAGDYIWSHWVPGHHMIFGLIHGALLFAAAGFAVGVTARHALRGAAGGAAIGLAAAAGYYLLAPGLGFSAMFVCWFAVWLGFAALLAALRGGPLGSGTVIARGAAAAGASGLAFYLISGIWRPFDPAGWDYAVHFAAWTVTYFPGFAALSLARGR